MWQRVTALFRRRKLDRDLDDEIRLHLDMLAEEYRGRGLSDKEARERAMRDFGGVAQVKETHREMRGMPFLEGCVQDVRFGFRTLSKSPGFTAVALLTLAIGIGANTTMFTVLNAVILQPLPYPHPERLMAVLSSNETGTSTFHSASGVYLDWRERNRSFEHLQGAAATSVILSGNGQPHRVNVTQVSHGFFDVLGVRPLHGRVFDEGEDTPGGGRSVLLDEGFWQREFGGRTTVIGERLILDDKSYVVTGVMPARVGFAHVGRAEIWMPLEANRQYRTGGNVIAIGHLKPGVSIEAAQAEMEAVMRGIGREHIEDSRTGVQIKPLGEWVTAEVRRMFQLVAAAAAVVFLICCVNVANLMVSRAMARRRELAIRASLGAGAGRLVRHLAAESLILAIAGGLAGAALASILVSLIPAIKSFYIPRAEEVSVDWRLLGIAAVTTSMAALVFGAGPAMEAAGVQITRALQARGSGRPGRAATRDVLVVAQFAMALMLLTGAGILSKSLWALLTIDTGFDRDRVVTVSASLPYKKYNEGRSQEFYTRLAAETSSLPGVRMVSTADHTPLEAVLFPYDLVAVGSTRKVEAMGRHVGPRYFDVLGIRVLAGRAFEPADDQRMPVPVLVNRRAAEALFGDANPIGKLIRSPYQRLESLQVIGVAADARQIRLSEDPGPQLYLPVARGYPQFVIAKVAPNAGDVTAVLRRIVEKLDPEVPAPEVSSMEANFDREIAKPRFYTVLLGTFAAIGVLLAAIGIYGVTSYAVTRRTQEFGVRMAVGARPSDILRLVVSGGVRLAAAGVAVGMAGAFAVTRMLASHFYGAKANDAGTVAGVVVLLVAVGLMACLLAARRATCVDPTVALRCD